jgi:microcystin-dependent protein
MEQVYSANSALVPPGTISMYITNVAPFGYLLCDGREVSRSSYRVLFNTIKTRFGEGDGETTFNLPDFRNRFPMGAGDDFSLANWGGEHVHTLESNNLPHHLHAGTTDSNGWTRTTEGGPANSLGGVSPYAAFTGGHTHTFTTASGETLNQNGTRVQNTPFSILNKYLAVYYIIKY